MFRALQSSASSRGRGLSRQVLLLYGTGQCIERTQGIKRFTQGQALSSSLISAAIPSLPPPALVHLPPPACALLQHRDRPRPSPPPLSFSLADPFVVVNCVSSRSRNCPLPALRSPIPALRCRVRSFLVVAHCLPLKPPTPPCCSVVASSSPPCFPCHDSSHAALKVFQLHAPQACYYYTVCNSASTPI